jgi:hypothetical protein
MGLLAHSSKSNFKLSHQSFCWFFPVIAAPYNGTSTWNRKVYWDSLPVWGLSPTLGLQRHSPWGFSSALAEVRTPSRWHHLSCLNCHWSMYSLAILKPYPPYIKVRHSGLWCWFSSPSWARDPVWPLRGIAAASWVLALYSSEPASDWSMRSFGRGLAPAGRV